MRCPKCGYDFTKVEEKARNVLESGGWKISAIEAKEEEVTYIYGYMTTKDDREARFDRIFDKEGNNIYLHIEPKDEE